MNKIFRPPLMLQVQNENKSLACTIFAIFPQQQHQDYSEQTLISIYSVRFTGKLQHRHIIVLKLTNKITNKTFSSNQSSLNNIFVYHSM